MPRDTASDYAVQSDGYGSMLFMFKSGTTEKNQFLIRSSTKSTGNGGVHGGLVSNGVSAQGPIWLAPAQLGFVGPAHPKI